MTAAERIETSTQFADTPRGWAERWQVELAAARESVAKWHKQGDEVVKRYLDERKAEQNEQTRWNLFTANVDTQQALLYGQTPKVDVTRRFGDARDDVARVAGETLQRLLNCDIESEDDTYAEALQHALEDRLLPGMGVVRIRYDVKMEDVAAVAEERDPTTGMVLVEAVEAAERKVPGTERVETDYVYWKHFLWSPARVWRDVRWVAFRADMSREQLVARFGKELGSQVPLDGGLVSKEERAKGCPDPWARAEVWEVWDKASRRVFWYVDGFSSVLDMKDDPLGLPGFFPCPRPLAGRTTTREFIPRPDFVMAQDLYNEIDEISTRVGLLTKAIRAAGVYDRNNAGVQRLLSEASHNELIPVDNWAMFAEKGGVRGAVDWLPLDQIVNAVTALDARREVAKSALYEVTGMSDLMRGQQVANGTPGEAQVKARFASIRMQRMQDEFARFASEVQRLKAHVISTQFDDATILARSNMEMTPDEPIVSQALAFIRDKFAQYRVEVKPESVSLADFAAMQEERSGLLAAVTAFVTAAAPLAQQMPGSMPFLLQMLQWFVSGQRGASEIEGVLDGAIAAAQQAQQAAAQQPPQPDPKLLTTQAKVQGDLAKVKAESDARLQEIQAEVAADAQREQNQMVYNVREAALKQQISDANRPETGALPGGRR